MANAPEFDVAAAHKHFAADCVVRSEQQATLVAKAGDRELLRNDLAALR